MHIILGGTGHIGSALAETLISKGEKVTIISRDQNKKQAWEQKGAEVAVVDIFDHEALTKVFKLGTFILIKSTGCAIC